MAGPTLDEMCRYLNSKKNKAPNLEALINKKEEHKKELADRYFAHVKSNYDAQGKDIGQPKLLK